MFLTVFLETAAFTNMGAAFEELNIRLSRNSFLNSPSLSFAPVIFLMTAGYPSDNYRDGLRRLSENSWYKSWRCNKKC